MRDEIQMGTASAAAVEAFGRDYLAEELIYTLGGVEPHEWPLDPDRERTDWRIVFRKRQEDECALYAHIEYRTREVVTDGQWRKPEWERADAPSGWARVKLSDHDAEDRGRAALMLLGAMQVAEEVLRDRLRRVREEVQRYEQEAAEERRREQERAEATAVAAMARTPAPGILTQF
jgi:hypothetical protein